jgi:arylsulfatase A-like enzyme
MKLKHNILRFDKSIENSFSYFEKLRIKKLCEYLVIKLNVFCIITLCFSNDFLFAQKANTSKPNIIIIYADDLGFGDISCNGTSSIKTTHIDKLAKSGTNFTNVHATSATCTPSRFSLLTGTYAWRKQGTGIAPGDAALIIPTNKETMPAMLQKAGYTTGVVGKWHLGLGTKSNLNWNSDIKPGPKEIGFDYSFILPATGDRVPCVFVENQKVVNLDINDSIKVSYTTPLNNNEPTGKNNPELLKMLPSHGHNMSIVNGVSRIGYMSGGKTALWNDEEMADVLVSKSVNFIESNLQKPFFLYLATHDIHVPRMPHSRFVGKSGMGPRGDVILQLDYTIGAIIAALKKKNILDNTLIILTSDNGAVLDDGYKDEAVEKLGKHLPNGIYRGGKYSAFEAGTRVPFILSWKKKVAKGKTSNVLLSQIDLFASLATLVGQPIEKGSAIDSKNSLNNFLNKSKQTNEFVIEQSLNNTLSIIKDDWKYIEPSNGAAINKNTNTELGNLKNPQLYNLKLDPSEKNNLAESNKEKVIQMKNELDKIKNKDTN